MDFVYHFLRFQYGNHDTKEKLDYYQGFITILLGELKTLRETMCTSCQRKCTSSKATRSRNRSFAISKDLMIAMRPIKTYNVYIPTSPRIPETDVWWRTPAPGCSSSPINERMASDSSSLSTERRNEYGNPIFYAKRDALADSTLDVTFIHPFHHKNLVRCVCFSRDGGYLAVGTGNSVKDGSIIIYEVESHKKYCELREYSSQYGSHRRPLPRNLCFSTNGKYLAVVDVVGRMIIWDVPRKRIRSIFHGSYQDSEVGFSPDGRLIAFCTDAGLVVLNMRDNSRKMGSEGKCFDFNPGGRLIATGNDYDLLISDVRTGKAVKRWNGHGRYLRRVKYTSDGRGLSCAYNDMIEQWDVSDAEPVLIRKFNVQSIYFYRTSISPDHRILAYSHELWDVTSGKRQYILEGHNASIRSVDFSAAGSYLAMVGYNGFVSLWRCRRIYAS